MTVSQLVDELGGLTVVSRQLYKSYKETKEREEELRAELIAKLDETGLRSAKTGMFMASMSDRSDIQVTHEQSVINWLKDEPNVEEDQYIGLKKTEFKVLAREVLKQTGEVIPGTETVHKETLTIKGAK